jgi:hypothetical protein
MSHYSNEPLTSFSFFCVLLGINLPPKWVYEKRFGTFSDMLRFFLNGCSPKLMPEGHFQNSPVVIDGKINDWGLPLRFSNPEYSMQYSVTNDDEKIYICVYSKDESFQKRILKAGMSICFDPKGEKDKTMSFVYPVKKPEDWYQFRLVYKKI